MPVLSPGPQSLLPVFVALALAFKTKNAVFSLLVGCAVGVVLAGADPATGLAELFQNALGNRNFIWVMAIVIAVGVMVAFYRRAGVIEGFASWVNPYIQSRRSAGGFAWLVSLFIFFADYFSPLFSGPIARPMTDRHRVSREMLAFILDSGSAPVCTLVPLSSWAVYITGLLVGYGPVHDIEQAMALFMSSIPFNFYGWFAVILAGLMAFRLLPHYGPMRRAERRAQEHGKLHRDDATPLTGVEMDEIHSLEGKNSNLFLYLVIPVVIVFGVALGTFLVTEEAKILEAFFAALIYQALILTIGGHFKDVHDAVDVTLRGIKAVLPALMILALAYSINSITKTLGAQDFILSITDGWMSPKLLPLVTFLTGAFISFFTGTSWGAYAILTPFVLPVAFNLSGGTLSTEVSLTVGALVGGALFGDHCSPVSDTTCLSSFGAGSDHMDHVTTQIPYALTAATLACGFYVILSMFMN